MKLINEINNELVIPYFCIYELNEEETRKYSGKYILSQGKVSELYLKEYGLDKFISNLRDYQYEGIFQTEKEAYFLAMYANMKHRFEQIYYSMKSIIEKYDLSEIEIERGVNQNDKCS